MPDETRDKEQDKMKHRFRPKPTYANVVASLALFLALGGAAVAATALPRRSVGPSQLRPNAVRPFAIARGAVGASKLARHSVNNGKLALNSIAPWNIGNGAVTSAKLAERSVLARSIHNGVITTNKLANGGVSTAKIADGAVTNAKLAAEVAPLLGTLKSGQTLRGSFDLGGEDKLERAGIAFQFPLLNAPAAPEANVLAADAKTTACPGLEGGNQQTPEAAPGQLCVYVKATKGTAPSLSFDEGSVNRLGFGLKATFTSVTDNQIQGFWAVTAP
jgi:hypothetical protein